MFEFKELVLKDTNGYSEKIGSIQYLYFMGFWQELWTRLANNIHTIITKDLLKFMNTLEGQNKSGGKNGISRLQYFLNAFSQELSLILANLTKLTFVEDDHFWLQSGGHGTNAPDLLFTTSTGKQVTLEAKMYFNKASYNAKAPTTNFHTADYCIAYIICPEDPLTGRWYFSKKSEGYLKLYSVSEILTTDPWLTELTLPTTLYRTSFWVSGANLSDLTDDLVPETVQFTIKNT